MTDRLQQRHLVRYEPPLRTGLPDVQDTLGHAVRNQRDEQAGPPIRREDGIGKRRLVRAIERAAGPDHLRLGRDLRRGHVVQKRQRRWSVGDTVETVCHGARPGLVVSIDGGAIDADRLRRRLRDRRHQRIETVDLVQRGRDFEQDRRLSARPDVAEHVERRDRRVRAGQQAPRCHCVDVVAHRGSLSASDRWRPRRGWFRTDPPLAPVRVGPTHP